jgi:hypothetical protein
LPSAPVQASKLACCDTKQLQPTRLVASAPTKSALINPSSEAEFRSQFLLRDDDVRALVVYHSRKYVKRALSLLSSP